MKLRKCTEHGYTLQDKCKICGKETKEAHYKYVRVGGAGKCKGFSAGDSEEDEIYGFD